MTLMMTWPRRWPVSEELSGDLMDYLEIQAILRRTDSHDMPVTIRIPVKDSVFVENDLAKVLARLIEEEQSKD